MFLNVNLARSPERVEMPLRGCLGTRSTGKAAMNCTLFHRLSAIRIFLMDESYVPAKISKKWKCSASLAIGVLGYWSAPSCIWDSKGLVEN